MIFTKDGRQIVASEFHFCNDEGSVTIDRGILQWGEACADATQIMFHNSDKRSDFFAMIDKEGWEYHELIIGPDPLSAKYMDSSK